MIGMTNLQEAKLAREAEICFGTLALATDYDCWNQAAGDVEIENVLAVLRQNVVLAQRTIRRAITLLADLRCCSCRSSLKDAIITETEPHSEEDTFGFAADHREIFMSVLVVGTVAFDSIETPSGSAERILGGSASYFVSGCEFFYFSAHCRGDRTGFSQGILGSLQPAADRSRRHPARNRAILFIGAVATMRTSTFAIHWSCT